ncbi:MAG TPA: aspartate kinase [Vicinamibacterales bacterium]|nr:aspartate kinase [Vicinamibacterales bacterium]
MNRARVMKFGGTSMADADAIARVAAIVAAEAARHIPLVVVVSAMSRITDELLGACGDARAGNGSAAQARVDAVEARHRRVTEALLGPDQSPGSSSASLQTDISLVCEELRAVLTSGAVLRELTARGADRVAAAGELMSSRIAAAALRQSGLRARWVDPRLTLVTDDARPSAEPLMDETRTAVTRHLQPVLEAGEVAVIGGFVGATRDGITTTLGRGGSDYSASILGAALHAGEIQIWTDVDGMLTADPRVVSNAQLVSHLSFDEASELAYFGAKVLHPSTIVPAVRDGIPVRILNTMRPEGRGSLITADGPVTDRALTALACKRNISVVDITSTRMLLAHGFLRRVFEVFEEHATSVDVVTTSEVSVSVTLDDDRRLEGIERDLEVFADVQVDRGMSILSAVGDNLRGDAGLAGRVIASLGGLPLRMVSQAASRRNVTVVLNDRDLPQAMERLHEEFFVGAGTRR